MKAAVVAKKKPAPPAVTARDFRNTKRPVAETPATDRATFHFKGAAYMEGYLAHSGQVVTVVRGLTEAENELSGMHLIRAADGWVGHAAEKEVER